MQKIRLSCELPSDPTTQGYPTVLTVRVENSSQDLLLLDRAWATDLRHQPIEWLDRPLGCCVYDAGQDLYRLHRSVPTRSAVPIAKHLVSAGGGCEAMLRLEPLESAQATLRVRGWLLPLDQAEERIYGTPDLHARQVLFRRGADPEASASMVIRTVGLEQVEAETTAPLEVTPAPAAAAALARAGNGVRILLRSRRIKAWVLSEGERLHLVEGERHGTYGAGSLDEQVFHYLEASSPFEPILVLFRGEAAEALRDSGEVPLDGDKAQRILQPADFWTLLDAAAARRLRVSVDQHSVMAGRGLTVSSHLPRSRATATSRPTTRA